MEQVKEKVCSEKLIFLLSGTAYTMWILIFRVFDLTKSTFFTELLFWQEVHKARKVIPPRTDVAWLMVAEGGEDHRSPVSGKCFPWPSWLAGTTRNAFIEHNWPLRVQGHCHPCWLHCGEELWCLKFKLGADAARRSDFEAAYHMEDGIVGKLLMVKWVVNKTWVQLWNC